MPAARTAPGAGFAALRLGDGSPVDVTVLGHPVAGGAIYADVVATTEGGDFFAKKHLGSPKCEDLRLHVSGIVSAGLFGWLAASWGPHPAPQDGALLRLDSHLAVTSQTDFSASLISETVFPALDATDPGPVDIVLRIVPALIETTGGVGTLSLAGVPQKVWHANRFRLEIAGLDTATVSRIESFTVRRRVQAATSGSGHIDLLPGPVEFPNLVVTLASAHAKTWHDWHHDFVVDGNNGDDAERAGALIFLAADLQTELSRIELHHVGIVRLEPAANPLRVTAELYCEQMVLVPAGGPS